MKNEHIWKLLARKLAGEATEEELKELRDLLIDDPELNYTVETLSRVWKVLPVEQTTGTGVQKLLQRIRKEKKSELVTIRQNEEMYSFFKQNFMFRNYLKIAWRNLARARAFSLINVTGLAIGMASAILILLWIQNELSFDLFHEKKDRLYLAYTRDTVNGRTECWNGTSMLLAPTLEMGYPEVETTARFNPVGAFVFHAGEKHLESHGCITEPGFLKMFDFPLLHGDPNTALSSSRSLVITETFAKKLFNDADPMGQMVRIDSNANFIVTGVMKNLPNNTTFDIEYLLPWSYMKEVDWDRPDWEVAYIKTFVLLKPGITEEAANAHFVNIIKSNSGQVKNEIFLHPISKWYLWSHFENGKIAGGRIKTVRLFGLIGAFILLIACINYMNLSTARSEKRAREVGIRKVAGAGKSSLIGQFLGESILISLIAGIIALVMVGPSLGWFNSITEKQLTIPYGDLNFWLSGAGFILFTGILAGSYPAFYLSAYKPIRVLKGAFKAVHALVTPRKIMVVLQFTFAISLIICTIIVYKQVKYGQGRDIGYNRNNLVFMFIKGNAQANYPVISRELLSSGAITSITRTNSPITQVWTEDDSYEWPGKDPNNDIAFSLYHTDKDFVATMGLKLISGRDINVEKYPADSNAIMLNESAAKLTGFKDPIGQMIKSRGGDWHVVGVVKDFITVNPFSLDEPTVIQGPGKHHWFGTMTFKLNSEKATGENINAIASVLKKYNPDYPFDYYFADKEFAEKFREEKRTGSLAFVFAVLTIFISCMGLFALAACMAENRTKEIGVRKVLGASVSSISALLSKDFLKLVLISFVIASPVAWWAMHHWLQNYSYRIDIGWWVFAVTGLVSVLIAILTVSYQSIKAALANPVKSLRTE
jgi:putative ABC transport system permease protein